MQIEEYIACLESLRSYLEGRRDSEKVSWTGRRLALQSLIDAVNYLLSNVKFFK